MGLSASLSVAFDKFKESSEDTAELTKNKVVFSSGGPDMPAPIGLKLLPIDEAFSDSYFNVLSEQFQCENLAARKENVKNLLRNYPNLKGARNPNGNILITAIISIFCRMYSQELLLGLWSIALE